MLRFNPLQHPNEAVDEAAQRILAAALRPYPVISKLRHVGHRFRKAQNGSRHDPLQQGGERTGDDDGDQRDDARGAQKAATLAFEAIEGGREPYRSQDPSCRIGWLTRTAFGRNVAPAVGQSPSRPRALPCSAKTAPSGVTVRASTISGLERTADNVSSAAAESPKRSAALVFFPGLQRRP